MPVQIVIKQVSVSEGQSRGLGEAATLADDKSGGHREDCLAWGAPIGGALPELCHKVR